MNLNLNLLPVFIILVIAVLLIGAAIGYGVSFL